MKGEKIKMAFMLKNAEGGRIPNIEYLPAGAITPKIGMALTQSAGNLALCTGANTPKYISMCEREEALTAGDIIPVVRVLPDMVFETKAQAALTSVKYGDKVTIHTDGLQITATTTSGVAEIIDYDGTAVGSAVRVRFNPETIKQVSGS